MKVQALFKKSGGAKVAAPKAKSAAKKATVRKSSSCE